MNCGLVRADVKPKSSEQANDEAYQAVQRFVDEPEALMKGRKRKWSATHLYTTAVKTAFGKQALQFGNKSAVVKNSKELGFKLPETTVINFKRELGQQLKSGKDYGELDITNRKRGRPLLLPAELDDLRKQFIGSWIAG